MLGRSWCHTVLATIRNCGSWTHRYLHGTEGLHFQTILRMRGYHWDHRKGTVGFGEAPAEFKPRNRTECLGASIIKISLF